jgi:ATP-dependent 26S proteasome regulatory subunit
MEQYASVLIAGVVSEYAPGIPSALRMQLGMFVAELFKKIRIDRLCNGITKHFRRRTKKRIIINEFLDKTKNIENRIYKRIEEYLTKYYASNFELFGTCEEFGNNKVFINSSTINSIVLSHNQHKININVTTNNENGNSILVDSSSASHTEIIQCINTLKINGPKNTSLTVFKPIIINDGKKQDAYWTKLELPCNKRFYNVILNKKAEFDIYENIKDFFNNLDRYDELGIPPTKGYLLYGLPGTGKTSVVKAIAAEYALDIYDFGSLNNITNVSFNKLCLDINYSSPHILLFDEFDKNECVKKYGATSHATSYETLLNVIDGIIEPRGRVSIFIANDISWTNNYPALIRPGRIDKQIKLDVCDEDQAKRICELFNVFDKIDIDPNKFVNMTPANVINILKFCYNTGTIPELDTINKNQIDTLTKKYQTKSKSTYSYMEKEKRLVSRIKYLRQNLDPTNLAKKLTKLKTLETTADSVYAQLNNQMVKLQRSKTRSKETAKRKSKTKSKDQKKICKKKKC